MCDNKNSDNELQSNIEAIVNAIKMQDQKMQSQKFTIKTLMKKMKSYRCRQITQKVRNQKKRR